MNGSDEWQDLLAGGQCEFYDLNSDPYNQVNLFDDPGYWDRLRARQECTSGTPPLPDDD